MTQSHRRSRPVVKDNEVFNARRASGKPKSNATSFKKGRTKTGGRKAGTPNKMTRNLIEAVLAGGEAAGNKVGRDGLVSYFKWVALNHPASYLSLVGRMPQQPEPEQTSPSEGKVILRTVEDFRNAMIRFGVPMHQIARLASEGLPEQEHSGTAGPTSSTDDRRVEDDASDDSDCGK